MSQLVHHGNTLILDEIACRNATEQSEAAAEQWKRSHLGPPLLSCTTRKAISLLTGMPRGLPLLLLRTASPKSGAVKLRPHLLLQLQQLLRRRLRGPRLPGPCRRQKEPSVNAEVVVIVQGAVFGPPDPGGFLLRLPPPSQGLPYEPLRQLDYREN
ncbi:unnamed protein product [Musa banksii]